MSTLDVNGTVVAKARWVKELMRLLWKMPLKSCLTPNR